MKSAGWTLLEDTCARARDSPWWKRTTSGAYEPSGGRRMHVMEGQLLAKYHALSPVQRKVFPAEDVDAKSLLQEATAEAGGQGSRNGRDPAPVPRPSRLRVTRPGLPRHLQFTHQYTEVPPRRRTARGGSRRLARVRLGFAPMLTGGSDIRNPVDLSVLVSVLRGVLDGNVTPDCAKMNYGRACSIFQSLHHSRRAHVHRSSGYASIGCVPLAQATFIMRLSVRTQEVSFRATTRPATRNVKQMARKI